MASKQKPSGGGQRGSGSTHGISGSAGYHKTPQPALPMAGSTSQSLGLKGATHTFKGAKHGGSPSLQVGVNARDAQK